MKQFQHQCIKPDCQTTYSDEDVDAYLCAPCTEVKNKVAAQIDAKFAGAPKTQPMSALQEYDAAQKVTVRGMKFLQVKS